MVMNKWKMDKRHTYKNSKFDVNKIAFEIHEAYHKGELSGGFLDAWHGEWVRVHEGITGVSGTTILGDTFEFTQREYVVINGKKIYAQ